MRTSLYARVQGACVSSVRPSRLLHLANTNRSGSLNPYPGMGKSPTITTTPPKMCVVPARGAGDLQLAYALTATATATRCGGSGLAGAAMPETGAEEAVSSARQPAEPVRVLPSPRTPRTRYHTHPSLRVRARRIDPSATSTAGDGIGGHGRETDARASGGAGVQLLLAHGDVQVWCQL